MAHVRVIIKIAEGRGGEGRGGEGRRGEGRGEGGGGVRVHAVDERRGFAKKGRNRHT